MVTKLVMIHLLVCAAHNTVPTLGHYTRTVTMLLCFCVCKQKMSKYINKDYTAMLEREEHPNFRSKHPPDWQHILEFRGNGDEDKTGGVIPQQTWALQSVNRPKQGHLGEIIALGWVGGR